MVKGFENNSAVLSDTPNFVSQLVWFVMTLQSKINEMGIENNFQFMICDILAAEVCLYNAKLGQKVMIFSPVFRCY